MSYTQKDPTDDEGPCALCGKECENEDWCYGCGAFICDGCADNPDTMGDHDPEDHKV
jgi:hypothetical protein